MKISLQLLIFYESFKGEFRIMPFIKPLIVFKAQPEGYDPDDPDWEGDVTKAPGLSKKELKSYDSRCDVAFSTKAWMNKQVCEYDVQRILDAIGDENILLQLDGYESYLNAIKKIGTYGHIREVVSPGDCTDLCSTVDQELGSFVKKEFNKSFQSHFEKQPDRWQMGKVSAKERRKLFTVWTCDAVAALMKRPDIIRRAFRGTGVGIDIEGKMKENLRFPGFDTYVPPEKDEEHLNDLLTKEEIEEMEKREAKFQEEKKKRKRKEREEKKRKRAKERAQKMKN